MLASTRRALTWSAAGALLAAALSAGYLTLRSDSGLHALPAHAEQLLLSGALTGVVALAASWAVARAYRRALAGLTPRVAALSDNPAPLPLRQARADHGLGDELQPLYDHL